MGGKKHGHLDATENAGSSSVPMALPLIYLVFTPTPVSQEDGCSSLLIVLVECGPHPHWFLLYSLEQDSCYVWETIGKESRIHLFSNT
jgi:hypothetical protein